MRLRAARPLAVALLGAAALAAALLAGCGRSPGPVRSPLDDRGGVATFAPSVQNYPPPFLPPTETPPPAAPLAPSAPAELESAAAFGIDALSSRMGVSVTRFSVVSIQVASWRDGCLGVTVPGVACPAAPLAGYLVMVRLDTGSQHEVHTSRTGAAAWAPQRTLHATLDANGTDLGLTTAEGTKVRALVGPGTQLVEVTQGALKPGDRIVLGADDLGDGSPLRVAWLARDR